MWEVTIITMSNIASAERIFGIGAIKFLRENYLNSQINNISEEKIICMNYCSIIKKIKKIH